MKAIVNTNIITEYGMIWDGAVLFEDGLIAAAGFREEVKFPEGTEMIDAGGRYTAPGLIDIHCHGAYDCDFARDPLHCAKYHLSHGVTTVLPTFGYTLTFQEMMDGADRVRKDQKSPIGSTMKYGLYMEGPYMNGEGGGISSYTWGGPIRKEQYIPLTEKIGDLAAVWAVDPEREGIEEFIQYAKKVNPKTVFAYGHSHATSECCRKMRHYGFRVQTHHGDSGLAKGRAQGTPGSGCDEYAYTEPELYAELIVDSMGIHVVPDLVKMTIDIKGPRHVCLITDSTKHTGSWNNAEAGILYGPDLNYDDIGYLDGSCLTLENACRNVMKHTPYGLCHTIMMATITPARMLGIDSEVGSLEAGKRANFILTDDKMNISEVWLDGEPAVKDGTVLL